MLKKGCKFATSNQLKHITMYKAKIEIKNGNEIVDTYYFSDDDKGKLLLCATSWFLGYVKGYADTGVKMLYQPCCSSLDGYQAWDKEHKFTMKLLNANGEIIKDINTII